jgi:Putative addiction module component
MITLEQQLATVAIALPPRKRAKLAELILKTLESQRDEEFASLWADEALARSKAYRKGQIASASLEKSFGFKL